MRHLLLATAVALASLSTVGVSVAQDRYDRTDRSEYRYARYGDDRDDRWDRRGLSRGEAIAVARRYGIVRVEEVERDDGGWEIEGRDRRGREIEVEINSRGRVTDVEYDD